MVNDHTTQETEVEFMDWARAYPMIPSVELMIGVRDRNPKTGRAVSFEAWFHIPTLHLEMGCLIANQELPEMQMAFRHCVNAAMVAFSKKIAEKHNAHLNSAPATSPNHSG